MGQRQRQTREFWESELAFIRGEHAKGAARRMKGFDGYVRMQAGFCEDDGFHWLARDMQVCLPSAAGCDETAHYKAGG